MFTLFIMEQFSLFIQNFITCKIISYYFNGKVSWFLNVNLSLVKQNHKAFCFIFWTLKFVSLSAQRSKPTIKFWGDEKAVRNSVLDTCSKEKQLANRSATHVGIVDKWPQNHKAHRQFNYSYNVILLIN